MESLCKVCRGVFTKKTPNSLHCESCLVIKQKAFKQKYNKFHYTKRFQVKICGICSTVFKTTSGMKAYCNKECTAKAARIRVMEKQIIIWQNKIIQLKIDVKPRYIN